MGNTTFFSIEYPTPGGSENIWGTTLNNAIISIDTHLNTINTSIPTSIVASSITDTPSALGTANQQLKMNSGATALEFFTPSILDMSDTPSSLGTSGQILKMNSGGTALEFATDDSGSGMTLGSLSVSNSGSSSNGSLSYDSNTGQFTFAQVDTTSIYSAIAATRQGATSSDMTVTGGGTFTFAHGLNAAPFMIQWAIKCTQADHGYSAGTIIYGTDTVANASHSPSVYVESGDITNVKGVFPGLGTFQIASKASGVVGNTVTTTAGRWSMHVKVMK